MRLVKSHPSYDREGDHTDGNGVVTGTVHV